jgi:hypothetical protein
MKLKPVVLAIVAAGLVGPAFAAYGQGQRAPSSACGMPVTGMSHAQELMNGNGVYSDARSRVCWHDKVRFSGFADIGYTHAKDNNSTTKGIDLWSAGLVMDAKINPKWSVKAVGQYGWIGDNAVNQSLISYETGADLATFDSNKTFHMDETVITYSDANRTPLYFKIGKGYVNFGSYSNPYAVFPTLTQSMSQLNENYIELGMVSGQGWHASVTGWNDDTISGARKHQGAAKIGFDQRRVMSGLGLSGDVSYISNLETVVEKSSYYNAWTTQADVSGLLAHVNLDLSHGLNAGMNYLRASGDLASAPSKETIWGVDLAYKLRAAGYAHEVTVDYEDGKESTWKHRWSVCYNVDLAPNVKGYAQYAKLSAASSHGQNTTVSAKGWLVGLKGSF